MTKKQAERQYNREIDDAVASMERTVEQEFTDAGRRVGQAIAADVEARRRDVRARGWSASPITITETMAAVEELEGRLAGVMQTLARMAHAAEEAEHARREGADSSAAERAELAKYVQSVVDDAVRAEAGDEATD